MFSLTHNAGKIQWKGNMKVYTWERITSYTSTGGDCLGSTISEKTLEVLVDTKVNMRQQCALVTNMDGSILGCIRKSLASRLKR